MEGQRKRKISSVTVVAAGAIPSFFLLLSEFNLQRRRFGGRWAVIWSSDFLFASLEK